MAAINIIVNFIKLQGTELALNTLAAALLAAMQDKYLPPSLYANIARDASWVQKLCVCDVYNV